MTNNNHEVAFDVFPHNTPPTVRLLSGVWEGVEYAYTDLTFKYVDDEGLAKLRFSYDIKNWSIDQQTLYENDSKMSEEFERLIGNILAHIIKDASVSMPSCN